MSRLEPSLAEWPTQWRGCWFVHARETEAGITFAAETGFPLARDPRTVVRPTPRSSPRSGPSPLGRTERYWPGARDFAAEVVSAWATFADVEAQAFDWLAAGAKLVLVYRSGPSHGDVVPSTERRAGPRGRHAARSRRCGPTLARRASRLLSLRSASPRLTRRLAAPKTNWHNSNSCAAIRVDPRTFPRIR